MIYFIQKSTEKKCLYNMPSEEYNATCEECNQEIDINSLDLIYLGGFSCILHKNY